MTPLYSLRTDGDQWRITKFVDGDVESSYLTTHSECDCPAGHRHTCRHRQMLPQMLAHKLCDTHWFFCFDTGGQIVDFNGTSKHLLDQLAADTHPELARIEADEEDELAEGSRTQEETAEDTLSLAPVPAGQHCQQDTANAGSKSWRRL